MPLTSETFVASNLRQCTPHHENLNVSDNSDLMKTSVPTQLVAEGMSKTLKDLNVEQCELTSETFAASTFRQCTLCPRLGIWQRVHTRRQQQQQQQQQHIKQITSNTDIKQQKHEQQ